MDRYAEVKLLLKRWEGDFLREHERRPTKADIEKAPEETQNLYREYRALKQKQQANESVPCVEDGAADQAPESEEPDSWGTHLNRAASLTPKMTSSERASLKASAQYYGMKLKSNLGGAGKNRPWSLKKPLNPRSPANAEKKTVPSPACVSSEPSTDPPPDPPPDPTEDLPLTLGLRAHKVHLTPSSHNDVGKKLHQLQSKVGQRLSSLDPDWLQRCELRKAGEGKGDKPIMEEKGGRKAGMGLMDFQWSSVDGHSPHSGRYRGEVRHGVTSIDDTKVSVTTNAGEDSPHMTTNAGEDSPHMTTNAGEDSPHMTTNAGEDSPHMTTNAGEDSPHMTTNAGEDSPHMTTNATEKISEPLTNRWPNRHLKEVDTNLEEQRKPILPIPERKKEVLHHPPGPIDGPSLEEAASSSSNPSSVQGQYKELEGSTEDSKGTDVTPQDGKVSRRKRRRDATNNPDPDEVRSQKRQRKTKLTAEEKSPKRRKKSTIGEDSEDPPRTDLPSQMTENLLGEMMEEEDGPRSAVHTQRSGREPPRRTENFVRINLKKKSHVKNFVLNGNRLRKQMWKQKFQKKGEQFGGGGKHFNHSEDTCFHCGMMGHWASQCPGKVLPVTKPEETEPEEEERVPPSLEDVARMTNTQMATITEICEDHHNVTHEVVRPVYEPATRPPAMTPLYELEPSGAVRDTPPEVNAALAELGYQSFRPGQEEAVMRIMSGLSSLVILSTGMGKSLCYQLPAYLYAKRSSCITLVISPLVSLMDDQVSGLPSNLKAVCIHSNMTKAQREAAVEKVKQGKVHVLLLSPEALVGGGRSGSSCLPPADQLPPVAFACIDEVHCVSEWSHNFRPCYLRLCKVLQERLGVRCLLGLTATATLSTAQDVARHLGVLDIGKMPLRLAAVPPNLHLSVSMDQDRDKALVTLLKGDRFGCLDSVIIYCTRREETQRLAAMLRTCLQGVIVTRTAEENESEKYDRKKALARKKIRRPLKWMADTYHAGLSAAERRRVQNNFMSGQLRIVVATVAFGMGLDKADVGGIIHYNMPKNFESYVQEIGRAGRDGKDAHCHFFLDPNAQDLDELRRHVHADSVDYITVKKLVQRVFPKCKCRDIQKKRDALRRGCELNDDEMLDFLAQCDGQEEAREIPPSVEKVVERACHRHERVVPIEETVQALDVREEGIETLLCYLELHSSQWLELLHPTLSVCRVTCYSGPQQLRALAHSCPPVAVALARERMSGVDHTHASSVEFNVVDVADSMGWEVNPVKRALRNLQWNSSSSGGFRGTGRSGILAEFSGLSFHFRSYGDLTDEELEDVCDFLHHKVSSREATALRQLKSCYRVFQSVTYRSSAGCAERVNLERSAQLKAHILEYFEGRNPLNDEERDNDEEELSKAKAADWLAQLSADVRHFLSIHQDERFSGRALARIFHGIGSPCYPAQVYGRDRRFWRKFLHLDFNKVMQICKEEIIRLR
ncbi:ATP-dependent DNA helicase Q4 isoform X2 [Rana temporaria]|uniref:ATP-dependent DNA helicase Q4 isoform X2 n=1 Tax=Rana temporaria TaxID=8407 RepID=UPI001AAD14CA|nr:ATP-dependent DNA helicase Q4 isoform X2 [Rana temporaria]